MSPLKNALMSAGFKISVPLLAGHGGNLEDIEKSTWQDWYETVCTAFTELRRDVEKIYFVGFSLGGLLGLKLAIDEGWGVRALALLSAPVRLSLINRMKLASVRYSPLRYIIRSLKKDFSRSVTKPEGRELYKQMSTERFPLSATYQIADLQKELLPQLKKISNPLLLMYGKKDLTTPPFNAELLKRSVSSDVVETEVYERSQHILTLDWDSEAVISRVLEFFNRFS